MSENTPASMTPIPKGRASAPLALLAALAALGAGGCANSRHTGAGPSRLQNPAYQRELRKRASGGFSGAVGIVATDAGTWTGAAGWADARKFTGRPLDRVVTNRIIRRPHLRSTSYGLGIFRSLYSCGAGWGHGGLPSYGVNVVAGDGSKAVITAQNNPRIDDDDVPERLYCS